LLQSSFRNASLARTKGNDGKARITVDLADIQSTQHSLRAGGHRLATSAGLGTPMSVESLTYADLGGRLGTSPEAARALARRLRLPR
jgi:hypothetical protein